MTLLTVGKAVAKAVGLEVPSAVAAATAREYVELLEIILDAAAWISDGHDWQTLKRVATITGDGSTEDWDLPSDYKRMTQKSQLWSSSLETALSPISDVDYWLGLDVQSFDFVINAWILYADQIHIKPALASAITAKYFYISNLVWQDSGSTNIVEATADTDVFRLDERLLEYAAIWKWKMRKGQAYAEEMQDYDQLLSRLVARDKGSRLMRIGHVRMPIDTKTAYPQNVSS